MAGGAVITNTAGPNTSLLNSSQQSTITAESGIINAIYGEEGANAEAEGQSQAEETEATGDIAEMGDYEQAAQIADNNAGIAEVSGQIQEYQNTRNVMATIGAQKSDIAAAGFQESGTALSLASSSLMQGLLQNQVIGTNANLQAGGYLQQAAASTAEAQTAKTASEYATDLSQTDASVAAIDSAAEDADAALLSQISTGAGTIAKTITGGGDVSQVINSELSMTNQNQAVGMGNPSITGGVDSAEFNL